MKTAGVLFAIAALGLSLDLGAEAISENNVFFGNPSSLVIEEAAPVGGEAMCTSRPDVQGAECWASYKAVLTARFRKAPAGGLWT